jgi:hypothetical protein
MCSHYGITWAKSEDMPPCLISYKLHVCKSAVSVPVTLNIPVGWCLEPCKGHMMYKTPRLGLSMQKSTQYMANEYAFFTLAICEALGARPDYDIYQRRSVFHPLPFRYDSNCLYTLVIYIQTSIKSCIADIKGCFKVTQSTVLIEQAMMLWFCEGSSDACIYVWPPGSL